ncbi:MAG: PilZ domain-containing protein [Burkholderiaceae bacterium]|jgi:c-di-GMP-binding flagellar brake protein YcgR|nr:PilZ domain-containing protein [Burkholderiaceae bacterium]
MTRPSPLPHDERRGTPRFKLVIRGRLLLPGRKDFIEFRTSDLSMGGVGIVHDQLLPAGAQARIGMMLMPDGVPEPFEAEVRIQHSTFGAMVLRTGLQFVDMSPEHQALLKRMLDVGTRM